MDKELTAEQEAKIRGRSAQARAFLDSELHQELEQWIMQEQALAMSAIIFDRRKENNLEGVSRESFVERMCAYYTALPTLIGTIKGWAGDSDRLDKQKGQQDGFTESTR